MAVAIKTSPGARPGNTPPNPAVPSLLGVVFVVVCLALLFKAVPTLWWGVWDRLGLGAQALLGGSLLLGLSVILAGLFVVAGARLASAQAAVGVRAGTFVGLCLLLTVLLLTRWASVWIEHWAFNGAFHPSTGVIITGVVGGLILLVALRVFMSQGMQKAIVAFEEAGWFSTASYKANQGQIVRRGTIFGILLLAGAGIYTLLLHNTLRRFGPDLTLNIPFTGGIAVEGYGDALDLVEKGEDASGNPLVPLAAKSLVEIRHPGVTTLRVGQQMTVDAYKAGLRNLVLVDTEDGNRHLKLSFEDAKAIEKALDQEPATFLAGVNTVIYDEVKNLLSNRVFDPVTEKRIRQADADTDVADLSRLVKMIDREAKTAAQRDPSKEGAIGPELNLPIAVLVVDRFAMREVDTRLDPKTHVKIKLNRDPASKLKTGMIVTKEEFDAEIERIRKLNEKGLSYAEPDRGELYLPHGPARYASLTLLPAIQYTVPLLLVAAAIWFAWRAVNMPAFADFLIATEAEMQKVSWTSHKRLMQDTVVVLATVFLMAVFLFLVDWGWKFVLEKLNVLHIPKAQETKSVEKKPW